MLQECHALNEDLEIWNKSLGNGKCLFAFFKYKKCRSGNIAKTNREIIEHIILFHGRIRFKVEHSETVLTLVNVYGPNHKSDRGPFVDKLQYVLSCYDDETKS